MKTRLLPLMLVAGFALPQTAHAHGGRGGAGGGSYHGGGGMHASAPAYHGGGNYHAPSMHVAQPAFHSPTFSHAAPVHSYGAVAAHSGFAARPGYAPHPGFASHAGFTNLGAGYHSPIGYGGHAYGGLGYRPNFYGNRYYGNWYHGMWHGNWGGPWGAWPPGWGGGYMPGAWGIGLGGFGAGLMAGGLLAGGSPYNWGYYGYSNPYWNNAYAASTPYINYGQPLLAAAPVQQADAPPAPPDGSGTLAGPSNEAMDLFGQAREDFVQGNYPAALQLTNQALGIEPGDLVFHEFRALCLFATGDYKQAAAAAYAVLSAGPGWDWTTMSSLYPNQDVYTTQLRALEAYRDQNPSVPEAHFLLAYHYLRQGNNAEAAEELASVKQLQPTNQLAGQLLQGLQTPKAGDTALASPPPAPAPPAAPVDAATLVGSWKASRDDGSTFLLNLEAGNRFTWKYGAADKQQVLSGTYTFANNYLILKANDQNTLIGQVVMASPGQFSFKLAGGNPADPGLDFSKSW